MLLSLGHERPLGPAKACSLWQPLHQRCRAGCSVTPRRSNQRAVCRSATSVPQALVDKESEHLAALNKEGLLKALHQLGEPCDAGATKPDLLRQLAVRRVREKLAVVRFPLRLTFTGSRRLRRYLTIPVDVEDLGFADFLLEAMTYNAVIIPEFRERLGLGASDGEAVQAMGTNGPTVRQRVHLPQMWIGMTPLPPTTACVSELMVGSRRGDVGGLLGIKVLTSFDLDVDPAGNQLAFHPAGHAALGLVDTMDLIPIPCTYHKAGAICIPVYINGQGPITGLVDLSSSISMVNWEAAALLGMTCTALQQQLELDRQLLQQQEQQQQPGGGPAEPLQPSTVSSSSSTGAGDSQGVAVDRTAAGASTSGQVPAPSYMGYYGCINIQQDKVNRPGLPAQRQRKQQQQRRALTPDAGAAGASRAGASSRPDANSAVGNKSGSDTTAAAQQPAGPAASGASPQQQQHQVQPQSSPVLGAGLLGNSSSSRAPGTKGSSSSSSRQRVRKARSSSRASSGSSSISVSGQGQYRLQRLDLQQHDVPASGFDLVLGDPGQPSHSLKVNPPSRIGVAYLRSLRSLGLMGQPAILIGADIWAKGRAVLCLEGGVLFLAPQCRA